MIVKCVCMSSEVLCKGYRCECLCAMNFCVCSFVMYPFEKNVYMSYIT